MNKFAHLWPDTLSEEEPLRDLGYAPKLGLKAMVANVLAQHEERNLSTAQAFKRMDLENDGFVDRLDLEYYVRRHCVRGREDYGSSREESVEAVIDKLMAELDTNRDGQISWWTFSNWNRTNSVESVVLHSMRDA